MFGMPQCRGSPMPAADCDGEEALYSCRICFEDAKPSEVGGLAQQCSQVASGSVWKADVAIPAACSAQFLVICEPVCNTLAAKERDHNREQHLQ